MGTLIIFFILGVFVIIALKNTIDHFMGIGGCCGDKQKIKKKHLLHIVDHRQVTILGIHCQNCENRIKNVINIFNEKVGVFKKSQRTYANDNRRYQKYFRFLGSTKLINK